MSNPVKRLGCFKCGTLGHTADACTQPRLCFNCRKPGHESSACPEPRSVAGKQCYGCGGIGHVQSDCPSLRNASAKSGHTTQKCHSCGRAGHLARFCPSVHVPGSAGFGRGVPSRPARTPQAGTAPVKCWRCGELNHYSRDCMAPAGTVVEGQQGVGGKSVNDAHDGPVNGTSKPKVCYKCHKEPSLCVLQVRSCSRRAYRTGFSSFPWPVRRDNRRAEVTAFHLPNEQNVRGSDPTL